MKELLKKFEDKQPEIVFEWNDSESEAKGWVVINSLRGGAAGGGTRMRKGLDKHEVLSLAKTMEIKFSVSGPAIGGAKSGINFDPQDPRKKGVLERWFKVVTPLLKNYYGTGGDMNVDEVHEVIPITEAYNIWHPQEGVLSGHFKPSEIEKINKTGQLRVGVSKVIEDAAFSPDVTRKYVIADMVTGYGVAESVKHFYTLYGGNLSEKRVIIQGWGNVASAAAFYLAGYGAKIVGIIDRSGGVLQEKGFTMEEVKTLFNNKRKNELVAPNLVPFEEMNKSIWKCGAEIFIPAAASRLVTKEQIDLLKANGLELISSGANVPFQDAEIFYGPTAEYADSAVSVIPDFIANCGMARVFAYMMQNHIDLSDKAIFKDVSDTIWQAMENVQNKSADKKYITKTAYEIALTKISHT